MYVLSEEKNEVYFCYKPTGLVSVLQISFLNGSILEEKKLLQKILTKKKKNPSENVLI